MNNKNPLYNEKGEIVYYQTKDVKDFIGRYEFLIDILEGYINGKGEDKNHLKSAIELVNEIPNQLKSQEIKKSLEGITKKLLTE